MRGKFREIASHEVVARGSGFQSLYRNATRKLPTATIANRHWRCLTCRFLGFLSLCEQPPQLPRLFVSVTLRRPICLDESIGELARSRRMFGPLTKFRGIPRLDLVIFSIFVSFGESLLISFLSGYLQCRRARNFVDRH